MGRVLKDNRYIGSVSSSRSVTYTYNPDGSIHMVATPDGKIVTYTVGGAGRPTSAADGSGNNYVTSATYAPPGELASLLNGAAIHGALSYNSRLQPLQIFYGTNTPPTITGSTCPSTVGNIMHKVYAFNFGSGDNGNVASISNCLYTTRGQSFTYDALSRIVSGQSSGTQWGETFTIDAWGNLTNETGISGQQYSEGLSAFPATNLNQLPGFGYDDVGNMITNAGTTYVYDAENRLIWTSGYRYVYDGDGKRVEKCLAGSASTPCPTSGTTNGTLYWTGAGSDALNESNLSGGLTEQYVFFGGARVARRDVSSGAVHYYFSDHLGSHSVIENATGTACEQDIDYYPYGGQENDYCPNVAQHYKFNGKERDSESGLDNFGARYYASSLARFMSVDPVVVTSEREMDPQQFNRYAYVRNNPLRLTDPTGEELTCNGSNLDLCFSVLKQIAGNAADHLSMNAKTGEISLNTQGLDLSTNEGASLINDLVQSQNVYGLDIATRAQTAGGTIPVAITENLPMGTDQFRNRPCKCLDSKEKPKPGVTDQVVINPNTRMLDEGRLVTTSSSAFHELAEAFAKVDGGRPYSDYEGLFSNGSVVVVSAPQQGAHNAAVQREIKLRTQRPSLRSSGRAGGDALIRDPHN